MKIINKQINQNSNIFNIQNSNYPDEINILPSVITSPTGNCQLSLISTFKNLFSFDITDKERIELLKEVCKRTSYLILVDIHRAIAEKTQKLLGDQCIHEKLDYTSTNNTLMTILLLKKNEILKL